jgi:Flp pilus assembly pilin Flp
MKHVRSFLKDTSGAVTVDWVVLCGAVVSVAVGIAFIMEGGVTAMSNDVQQNAITTVNAASATSDTVD